MTTLTKEALAELEWWIGNLSLNNGRTLLKSSRGLIISPDASTQGWGASCCGHSTGGQWSRQDESYLINVLELIAAKLATHQQMTSISKEIWDYAMSREIPITAEYLSGKLNVEADRESRQTRD